MQTVPEKITEPHKDVTLAGIVTLVNALQL
jgi:hypothetical protein